MSGWDLGEGKGRRVDGSVEKGEGDMWMGESRRELAMSSGRDGREWKVLSGWKGVLRREWAMKVSELREGKGRRLDGSVVKEKGDEWLGVS